MVATNRAEVLNWKAIIAAMLYLATFFAASFSSINALIGDGRFIEAFVFAFPRALGASVLIFICCVSVQACRTALKRSANKVASANKRLIAH